MVATPADVRARALAAATRLFAAHGVQATSVQAVADAVGVTKQAVHRKYASGGRFARAKKAS